MKKERIFLLRCRPSKLRDIDGSEVIEGRFGPIGSEVSVRSAGSEYTLIGGRRESNGPRRTKISKEAFGILWPTTVGRRIAFRSFELPEPEGVVWTINEYFAGLEGTVLGTVSIPFGGLSWIGSRSAIEDFISEEIGPNHALSRVVT